MKRARTKSMAPKEKARGTMARQGHSVVTKPSRSDEVLDADEQIKIANEVRAHFDSLAPKRHTKPNRSEQDMADSAMPLLRHDMPEHDRLLSLQSQSYVSCSSLSISFLSSDFSAFCGISWLSNFHNWFSVCVRSSRSFAG